MRTVRLLAVILMIVGLVLLALSLATPEQLGGGGMRSEEQTAYSLSNVAMAGAGGFLLATGMVLFFFRDEYQPLKEDVPTPPTVPDKQEDSKPITPPELPPGPTEDDYLVLRLLSGDERTMFRAVVDSGGEALQKDLIVRLKWSDAKVSRVIDRLIEKGVVTKERHGSTNKIRVSVDK